MTGLDLPATRWQGERVPPVAGCHPERSEGSIATGSEMLRCSIRFAQDKAQHDRVGVLDGKAYRCQEK